MKPILFNTEMVKAILDGRKSMTRRVVKNLPDCRFISLDVNPEVCYNGDLEDTETLKGLWATFEAFGDYAVDFPIRKSLYQPSDILWVRETWGKDENGEYVYRTNYGTTEDDSFPPSMFKWKPSIHMPREAARIFLRVTNVRVERLRKITLKDIRKEGIKATGAWDCMDWLEAFQELWNSIYAAPKVVKNSEGEILYYESYPWEDIQETREFKGKPWYVHGNPWVWVYEFERTDKP